MRVSMIGSPVSSRLTRRRFTPQASDTAVPARPMRVDHAHPDFRAMVRRDGTIRLANWGPWLAAGGPLHTLLDARGRAGVAIADITVVRDEDLVAVEAIVAFRCGGGDPAQRQALRDWAARVDYRRMWFDGEIADLDPSPGGAAQTRCTGCRQRLIDADASFWDFVRRRGAFPTTCMLCGSDLPQWTPAPQTGRPASDPDATENVRKSACR
jgi:hypothetical protein